MLLSREEWEKSPLTQNERVHSVIFEKASEASAIIAREISELIRSKAAKSENAVLGLATGSSPDGVYRELIRLHREEGLSFQNVITFNLDEYYPMDPQALQSKFMNCIFAFY